MKYQDVNGPVGAARKEREQAKITKVSFENSVFDPSQLPEESMPEIAFAGRSNVGKSSLLNRLLGRRSMVKVSSRPGFTQSLNFFLVNECVRFVDLPGYGYAKAPKSVQRKWQALVENYLESRKSLVGVVCILDIRRDPDQMDTGLIEYLRFLKRKTWIVLNKADKISQPKRLKRVRAIKDRLPRDAGELFVLSARTGDGVREFLNILWKEF